MAPDLIYPVNLSSRTSRSTTYTHVASAMPLSSTISCQSLIRNFLCHFLAKPIATLSFRLFAPAAQAGRVLVLGALYLLAPRAPATAR
jgi:hypothetical protein